MGKKEEPNAMETIAAYAAAADYKSVIANMYDVDGNAMAIIGTVTKALRRAKAPKVVIDTFFKEATSGDYEHVLKTCSDWVTVVNVRPEPKRGLDAMSAFRNHGIKPEVGD